jgi:hypothetical protein
MPNHFRRFLLLLSATWALLSIARLQPLQFSTEPAPWLRYALPSALTLALCFCPPETRSPLRWSLASASVLAVTGLLAWFPIVLFHLGVGPSPVTAHVVTLGLSAAIFWLGSRPAIWALTAASFLAPLLLYHVTSDVGFPVHIEGAQSYGPYRFVVERRGYGGPVHAGMQVTLIRETILPIPGLVWRRSLGPITYLAKFTATEMILAPDRRIPLEQLAGPNPDLSKM